MAFKAGNLEKLKTLDSRGAIEELMNTPGFSVIAITITTQEESSGPIMKSGQIDFALRSVEDADKFLELCKTKHMK